jgi:hypothetical protein
MTFNPDFQCLALHHKTLDDNHSSSGTHFISENSPMMKSLTEIKPA